MTMDRIIEHHERIGMFDAVVQLLVPARSIWGIFPKAWIVIDTRPNDC